MRKCKYCKGQIIGKKSTAKFCSDSCRKRYWEKYIEPRAVCNDCGTLLGVKSLRNFEKRNRTPRCPRCTVFNRIGTGKDF